jgi:hypothetical protein
VCVVLEVAGAYSAKMNLLGRYARAIGRNPATRVGAIAIAGLGVARDPKLLLDGNVWAPSLTPADICWSHLDFSPLSAEEFEDVIRAQSSTDRGQTIATGA